jgi:predicted SnoaL-like aldol condensation-catalyzing enzyme
MDIHSFFTALYKDFNERRIESVIYQMTDDVKWANGMDGGYVTGHEGVRQYWTRQFAMISSNVTPVKIETSGDLVKIRVHQVVHDLDKNLVADETVEHCFRLRDGKISEFHIGEKIKQPGT